MIRCPTLAELPPPPHGKTGWPWTEESPRSPGRMPDGRHWPAITIVTPSYNQGEFIEETIRSVLLQGYPCLEYMVMDGGSTDESLTTIGRYAHWIAFWTSEPDRGQAHAINKGLSRATGAVLAWLNSDDLYLPNALAAVGQAHARWPDCVLFGDVQNFTNGQARMELIRQHDVTFENLVQWWDGRCAWHQPGIFVPSTLLASAGGLDERLSFAFDRDWLCRLTQHAGVAYLDSPVARFRIHPAAKTSARLPQVIDENLLVARRYWGLLRGANMRYGLARHYLRLAAVCLGHHAQYASFWNRGRGLRCLLRALWQWPWVALSSEWVLLARRLVLPRSWLRSSPWGKQP